MHPDLRRRLRFELRILGPLVLVGVVMATVMLSASAWLHQRALIEQQRVRAEGLVRQVASQVGERPDRGDLDVLVEAVSVAEDVKRVLIVESSTMRVAAASEAELRGLGVGQLAEAQMVGFTGARLVRLAGMPTVALDVSLPPIEAGGGHTAGVVIVVLDPEVVDRAAQDALDLLTALCLVAVAVGLGLGWWVVHRVVMVRMTTITSVLRARAAGDLDRRVGGLGDDSLGGVAQSLDRLMDRVQSEMDQRAAQERIHRRLARVAERTDNHVLLLDLQGLMRWVNPAFENATGWSLDAIEGRPPEDVLHGPATDLEAVARLKNALASGEGHRTHLEIYTREGRPFWVDIELQPIRDNGGKVVEYIGVAADITEQLRLNRAVEAERDKAQAAAESRARFVATLSHEIRTPLNGLLGQLELMGAADGNCVAWAERLEVARRCGQTLLSLLNNTLDLSKIDAGRMELEQVPVDLRALMEEVASLLRGPALARGLRLEVDIDDSVPAVVRADPTRLRQVVWNLLGNAVKFTSEGWVRVKLRCRPVPGAATRLLELVVTDTGIGMDADALERLFEPFHQADGSVGRRYGGSGLGMAITQRILDAMGGRISAESAVGKGTVMTVEVEVGVVDGGLEADGVSLDSELVPQHVLVVDDDRVTQLVVVDFLRELGCTAAVATDGAEGVAAARKGGFDVIFMDARLPDTQGWQAVSQIRAQEVSLGRPRVPVVALTGDLGGPTRGRFERAGADAFVAKPFTVDDLARGLRSVLAAEA